MFKKLNKIFSMSCISFVLFSCGKQVSNSSDDSDVVDRPSLNTDKFTINMSVNTNKNSVGIRNIDSDDSGWVLVPNEGSFKVTSGDPLLVTTKVILNKYETETDFQDPEVYCEYLSVKADEDDAPTADGYLHSFQGCSVILNGEVQETNYIPGHDIPLDADQYIQVETHTSVSSTILDINYTIEVDWR